MAEDAVSSSILSVRDLTTSIRSHGQWRSIIRDISFDIRPQETVSIVGESGSGKSVTALSIMRLLPEYNCRIKGNVFLGDKDLLTISERTMRWIRGNEIGIIFQEPMTCLNPVHTVGFQITETLTLHRKMSRQEARIEAIRLLDRVGIPAARSRIDEYPHSFSGGMRQRAMIAMALACKPKLLIADEPTTALDVTIQAQILALIKSLQAEDNMAVLAITHDMGVVAEIADQTIVMHNGIAVESARTDTIFAAPNHPYTKTLLAAVPKLGSMMDTAKPRRLPLVNSHSGEVLQPRETVDTILYSKPPVLDVRNLITRFDLRRGLFGQVSGRVHAVQDVSLTLQPGETLSLVGESGCGKSTTGRSIIRLVDPDSGTILVNGLKILDLSKHELREARKNIQMIFQDPYASLNPRMTIGELIAEPMRTHNPTINDEERQASVSDLLVRVGLRPAIADGFPHEFSGGQRQRICIARALSLRPSVIIADEAVSALDASNKAQVINLLLDLQESLNLAYLFISHDMAIVERISHRVAVMYLGEIVEVGPRQAIFANAQHPYTKELISAVPIPDPSQRGKRRPSTSQEATNPIRDLSYIPPLRRYREVSENHFVQI